MSARLTEAYEQGAVDDVVTFRWLLDSVSALELQEANGYMPRMRAVRHAT